jgi:hypothetical protein
MRTSHCRGGEWRFRRRHWHLVGASLGTTPDGSGGARRPEKGTVTLGPFHPHRVGLMRRRIDVVVQEKGRPVLDATLKVGHLLYLAESTGLQ